VWFDAFVGLTAARAREARVRRTMRTLLATGTARVADERLLTIHAPAGLLWGRHDRMTPLGLGEHASARLGWPLQVVEDAAHVPHIEQPDAFVAALDALVTP
jgi:2-hydroxymuconate-semialdehyde hydrolase